MDIKSILDSYTNPNVYVANILEYTQNKKDKKKLDEILHVIINRGIPMFSLRKEIFDNIADTFPEICEVPIDLANGFYTKHDKCLHLLTSQIEFHSRIHPNMTIREVIHKVVPENIRIEVYLDIMKKNMTGRDNLICSEIFNATKAEYMISQDIINNVFSAILSSHAHDTITKFLIEYPDLLQNSILFNDVIQYIQQFSYKTYYMELLFVAYNVVYLIEYMFDRLAPTIISKAMEIMLAVGCIEKIIYLINRNVKLPTNLEQIASVSNSFELVNYLYDNGYIELVRCQQIIKSIISNESSFARQIDFNNIYGMIDRYFMQVSFDDINSLLNKFIDDGIENNIIDSILDRFESDNILNNVTDIIKCYQSKIDSFVDGIGSYHTLMVYIFDNIFARLRKLDPAVNEYFDKLCTHIKKQRFTYSKSDNGTRYLDLIAYLENKYNVSIN